MSDKFENDFKKLRVSTVGVALQLVRQHGNEKARFFLSSCGKHSPPSCNALM
jgi:hypothetical protein